jgi:intracellular septation protein
MHAIFEYLPLVIFFIFYKFGDLYWATGSLVVTSALQILYYVVKKQPIPKKNWLFFGLIAVFGGLTIFFHDDAFIKWKVTIINALFAIGLVVSNSFFNKNLIKELMGESLPLPEKIWGNLNLAWALFFLVCAILNIYIAYNFSLETWVNFKVFGLMGLTFIFAISTIFALYKYLPQEEDETERSKENN